MPLKYIYLVILFFSITSGGRALANQTLIINEIMQSNIDCVMDDLNEFPDSWVELANLTDHKIDLGDLFLNDEIVDSLIDLKKQPTPNVAYENVNPGIYLLRQGNAFVKQLVK